MWGWLVLSRSFVNMLLSVISQEAATSAPPVWPASGGSGGGRLATGEQRSSCPWRPSSPEEVILYSLFSLAPHPIPLCHYETSSFLAADLRELCLEEYKNFPKSLQQTTTPHPPAPKGKENGLRCYEPAGKFREAKPPFRTPARFPKLCPSLSHPQALHL